MPYESIMQRKQKKFTRTQTSLLGAKRMRQQIQVFTHTCSYSLAKYSHTKRYFTHQTDIRKCACECRCEREIQKQQRNISVVSAIFSYCYICSTTARTFQFVFNLQSQHVRLQEKERILRKPVKGSIEIVF